MKYQIREETWPLIDQFFQEMPESIEKLPTFQEALAETHKQSVQQGALSNEHRLVLRQLRRKFSHIPTGLVQHIEATSDIERLDHWLDQIILANELADIDFNKPSNQFSHKD